MSSKHSDAGWLKFLAQHEGKFDPALYRRLVSAIKPWADYQQKRGPAPRVMVGHDLLTGSTGNNISHIQVGKLTPAGVPISFKTETVRGGVAEVRMLVVMENGLITDILYRGNQDQTLRKALDQIESGNR